MAASNSLCSMRTTTATASCRSISMRRTSGKPVAIFLRPGKTPDGVEVACVLRHVIRQIRARWPRVEILVRGDSHYGRIEAITVCERNRVGYIFGLAGNSLLLRKVADLAEDVAVRRVEAERRESASARRDRLCRQEHGRAGPTDNLRRVIARVEAGPKGTDTRFIITNLAGTPEHLYEDIYCARGQAENLIKAHKLHLASDRTSCTKATANQFRLLVHTAAYWLMLTLRGLAPKLSFWRDAQFDTIRINLLKVAARVTEMATRIKVALPSSYPYQDSWLLLAAARRRAAALTNGAACPPTKPEPPHPSRRNPRPDRATRATLAHAQIPMHASIAVDR